MSELTSKYDISPREFARGRNLKMAAWLSPAVLSIPVAVITFVGVFLLAGSPPVAATMLFLGLVATVIGLFIGLVLSGVFAYRYSNWKDVMRERIAADGIKAEEVDWFKRELRPGEKRALREISASDELLADAYRETLASRLTASRIIRSSKKELLLTQRRQQKLRQLKTERSKEFQSQIKNDIEKLSGINTDAKQMLIEAESRLQMIEAAAMRGGNLAGSEVALKKLAARAAELPLALESAILHQEAVAELESDADGTVPVSDRVDQ
jgi:uncharacterized membrane protein YccC